MGQTKNYLLKVIENCSDHQFGQDAVEWAIHTNRVQLTGNLQTDLRTIMGEPGQPPEKYDEIIEGYRQASVERGSRRHVCVNQFRITSGNSTRSVMAGRATTTF